ncbi:hypothetical protein PLUTE_b6000 [Pseudoalteromonas luteoviolacea DSM 6061]|nr:hypothetical protein [Pseudoalteromonas luteoviolacea DSM 6061]
MHLNLVCTAFSGEFYLVLNKVNLVFKNQWLIFLVKK